MTSRIYQKENVEFSRILLIGRGDIIVKIMFKGNEIFLARKLF